MHQLLNKKGQITIKLGIKDDEKIETLESELGFISLHRSQKINIHK